MVPPCTFLSIILLLGLLRETCNGGMILASYLACTLNLDYENVNNNASKATIIIYNSCQNWINIPILAIFFVFFLIWIHLSIVELSQVDRWIQIKKNKKKIARIGMLIQFWKLFYNSLWAEPPIGIKWRE